MLNPENIENVRNLLKKEKDRIIAEYDAVGVGIGKNNLNEKEYVVVVYLKDEGKKPKKPVLINGISLKFEITGQFDLYT